MAKRPSPKVKNPGQKSYGFLWALIIVAVLIVGIIGFIVVSGEKGKTDELLKGVTVENVDFTVSKQDSVITLSSDKATDDTPQIDLFEDLSCHYCADLAKSSDADLKKAVEKGDLVINIHPLNFLDGAQIGHSTKAGAALALLAQAGDTKAYWNLRKTLFDQQADIYGKWDHKDFADMAKALGGSGKAVAAISNGQMDSDFAKEASVNADTLKNMDPEGKVSSPRVFQDGKEVKLADGWVDTVTSK